MTTQTLKISDLHIVCINLEERPDKRKLMEDHAKSLKLNLTFYTAKKHPESGIRGCLESHVEVVKMAKEKGWKYLMILEDDALFTVKKLEKLKRIPENWDMLYLGGTVNIKYILEDQLITNMPWVPVSIWTTHCYIINMENEWVVEQILKAVDHDLPIDNYYISYIHYRKHTYVHNPMMCLQRNGFSDIEGEEVCYDKMPLSLEGLQKPDHTINGQEYRLILPNIRDEDLPGVTIVTPTYERRDIFSIAIMNFNNFIYPKDKLEWVIIDDSKDERDSVKDMLPVGDKRIRFVRLKSKDEKKITVAAKRNFGASIAKNDYIVHMDDDDYYPPESVLARVKLLLKYPEIGCVGSSMIGNYDLLEDKSRISTDGTLSLAEASMAYKKSFWKERGFDDSDFKAEYYKFIVNRYDQVMDVPYTFIIYAITHNNNLTGKGRRIEENALIDVVSGEDRNYKDLWDIDIQIFITDLRQYLLKKMKIRGE